MSIVHVDKIWVEIAKNLRCGCPGGSVISDEGGGGVKKGHIFADVLHEWPLKLSCSFPNPSKMKRSPAPFLFPVNF